MTTKKIIKFDGAALRYRGRAVTGDFDEPAPVLPQNTIRCRFAAGYTPAMGDSQTLVDAATNTWDIYKPHTAGANPGWEYLFANNTALLAIIASNPEPGMGVDHICMGCTNLKSVSMNANGAPNLYFAFQGCSSLETVVLTGTEHVAAMWQAFARCSSLRSVSISSTESVTSMLQAFHECSSLEALPVMDTGNVKSFDGAFYGCTSLTTIPLLDTSSAENVLSMFGDCTGVESGALALYQQMSTQATPPSHHTGCFHLCGANAPAGTPIHAEMAQIPSSWGGHGG